MNDDNLTATIPGFQSSNRATVYTFYKTQIGAAAMRSGFQCMNRQSKT